MVEALPLGKLVEDDSPITYGVVKPGPQDADGVWFVRGGDIADGTILIEQLRTISHAVSRKYRRTLLRGGELLVSLVGNPGQVAVVPESLRGANIARQVGLLRLRTGVSSEYVKYFMLSRDGQIALGAQSMGSVQQVINLKDLRNVKIPLPPFLEQVAIANVLRMLDDKVESNRRMNAILDEIAKAIFRNWFVEAPEAVNWPKQDIHSIANVIYGAPLASSHFNSDGRGLPIIRIRDLSDHSPQTYTTEGHPKATLIKPGDVIAGMDGEFRLHYWRGPDAVLNQRLCFFKPMAGIPRVFVAESLREHLDFFERAKVGTTVIHLGKGDIETFRIVVPPKEKLAEFGSVTEPLLDAVIANAKESRLLTELRDALLPKLMSGEVRVGPRREDQGGVVND